MADDPKERGPADRARINLKQRNEVAYWTKALRCTEEQLKVAVKAVGVMTADVRRYLGKRLP